MITLTLNLSDEQWQQVKAIAQAAGMSPEAWVQARMDLSLDAAIHRRWVPPPEVPTLDELLRGITPENRHGEIDTGPPVTREAC
jgi:antitoxin component of MazEF toxin-antitoxin module